MTETYPFVSVILPIRNESAFIERTLQAVLNQDYPGKMEILVVDGMSTDDTRKKIEQITMHSDFEIRLLDNPGKIVPTGMNVALRQTEGEVIVRVDGHTVIEIDYVRQCVLALLGTGADNAGGRMKAIGDTLFGQAVSIATSTSFGIGGSRFHYSREEEWVDSVYMGAWRRNTFYSIGLFDEELVRNQDDEFNYRLRAAGGKILLTPAIKSVYTVRSTPSALWRQYFQYGFWKVRVLQKHPRQMSPRQFIPPLFVLGLFASLLLLLCAALLQPAWLWLALPVPLLYLLANLTASAVAARRRPASVFLRLPLIYLILHVSYGVGFLQGLVYFSNRWNDKRGKTPLWGDDYAGTS